MQTKSKPPYSFFFYCHYIYLCIFLLLNHTIANSINNLNSQNNPNNNNNNDLIFNLNKALDQTVQTTSDLSRFLLF